jgi:hypothetical protein
MSDDLFAIPPRSRRSDPDTSAKAAKKIEPHTPTIRQQVERFAREAGHAGFIDEDLSIQFGAENVSSYRTRRAELTDMNIILDTGKRRHNEARNECIVWIHREFVLQPPMPRERSKRPSPEAVNEALKELDAWQAQMWREGRLFAPRLQEAINVVKLATR